MREHRQLLCASTCPWQQGGGWKARQDGTKRWAEIRSRGKVEHPWVESQRRVEEAAAAATGWENESWHVSTTRRDQDATFKEEQLCVCVCHLEKESTASKSVNKYIPHQPWCFLSAEMRKDNLKGNLRDVVRRIVNESFMAQDALFPFRQRLQFT